MKIIRGRPSSASRNQIGELYFCFRRSGVDDRNRKKSISCRNCAVKKHTCYWTADPPKKKQRTSEKKVEKKASTSKSIVVSDESESGSEAEILAEAIRKGFRMLTGEVHLLREAIEESSAANAEGLAKVERGFRCAVREMAGVSIANWQQLPLWRDGSWEPEESAEPEAVTLTPEELEAELRGLSEERDVVHGEALEGAARMSSEELAGALRSEPEAAEGSATQE